MLDRTASRKLPGFLLALMIGGAGGYVFSTLSVPLAWMLGAMTFCTIAALLRVPIASLDMVRPSMTAVIGVLLGSGFGVGILYEAADIGVSILVMFGYLLLSTFVGLAYFRKFAGFDRVTALFAAMPGGLVEMTTLGSERGGNGDLIALVHAAQILLVVASLPILTMLLTGTELTSVAPGSADLFALIDLPTISWILACGIAGSWLGRRLGLPARYLVGPMLLSAIAHMSGLTDFKIPGLLVVVAQLILGTLIGCRFSGTPASRILSVLAYSVGLVAVLLAILAVVVLIAVGMGLGDVDKLLLAYAPGGMTEMNSSPCRPMSMSRSSRCITSAGSHSS